MASVYRRGGRGKYVAAYRDAQGRRLRHSTGTKSKRDAERIAAQWEQEALRQRHRLPNAYIPPLMELLDEYLAWLSCSTKHANLVRTRVARLLLETGWQQPNQIDRLEFELTVRRISRGKRIISAQTQRHYAAAFGGFISWMIDRRKVLDANPLKGWSRPNVAADRRLERRPLLRAEWPWLRLTPRSLLYETAIQTGLRSSELRALEPHHVTDDSVTLPGTDTKNGEPAQQCVSRDLADRLRDSLPFDLPDPRELAATLRSDLYDARAAWQDTGHDSPADFLRPVNAAGKALDFHSLRHTCGYWLAESGVNPKTIQAVMRHSSIQLTLDTYGHLLPSATTDAASELGRILSA